MASPAGHSLCCSINSHDSFFNRSGLQRRDTSIYRKLSCGSIISVWLDQTHRRQVRTQPISGSSHNQNLCVVRGSEFDQNDFFSGHSGRKSAECICGLLEKSHSHPRACGYSSRPSGKIFFRNTDRRWKVCPVAVGLRRRTTQECGKRSVRLDPDLRPPERPLKTPPPGTYHTSSTYSTLYLQKYKIIRIVFQNSVFNTAFMQ